MKVITTIKSGDGRALVEAIKDTGRNHFIFLQPGTYSLLRSVSIKEDMVIKGLGNHPEEVTIHGQLNVSDNVNLDISNVTIQAPHEYNGVYVKNNGRALLDKVIVRGEESGEYPPVWCENATLHMFSSEVYTRHAKSSACYICERSEAEIHYSIMDSINAIQSSVILHQSQVRHFFEADKNSIIKGTGKINFLGINKRLYDLILKKGSQVKFDQLHLGDEKLFFNLEEGHVEVKELFIDEHLKVEINKDETSTIKFGTNEDKVAINGVVTGDVSEKKRKATTPTGDDKKDQGTDGSDESEIKRSALEELHDMFGLHGLKKQVMKFINTVKFNQSRKEQGLTVTPITLHSLFMGNPGTGKTTVARIFGRVLYESGVIKENKFVEVTRKDLVAKHIGHTAQKTQAVLDEAKGGILFIDEAYALNSDSDSDFGKEAVDTLITFMEDNRENTMIIFAGYTDEMNQFLKMNSGLDSRIPNRFYFDDYLPEEIALIGYKNLLEDDYFVDEKLYKDTIKRLYSQSIDKSNVRWLRNVNEKLIQAMASRVIETGSDDNQTIIEEDFAAITGNQSVNKDEKIDEMLKELNELIGLNNVKEYVEGLMKQVKVDKMLIDSGAEMEKPTYHMVFAGNPGTGKTTVANIIAELFFYLDVLPTPNVKVVDRADLVGAYIGHTEKQTKEIIEQSMVGVLFIDEAYQLSSGSDNDFGKQAIETLITYLENYRDKFIVILAGYTNEMEKFLDMNPGLRSRIPLTITFPDYSSDEIATIVEKTVTKNWEVDVDLLKSTVIEIYESLPENEKANARWARNFTDRLIQHHKIWLSDNEISVQQLKQIHPEVIHGMKDVLVH